MTVEQVLEEVRALTPEERQRVRAALDEASGADEADLPARERAWRQRMEAKGLLRPRVAPSPAALEAMRSFQPLVIPGKSVSETIIEERR